MEKEFFDAASLPQDAVKIDFNQNLQFEFQGIVKDDPSVKWKHIYTEDSLRRVVLMAHKEFKKKDSDYVLLKITVHDAKGKELLGLGILDIVDLYILRGYLK
jgi:hypothetical protein